MNQKLEEFKQQIKGKDVGVIGIGVSNTPLIERLAEYGATVTARDKKGRAALGETADRLEALGVRLVLGEGYLDGLNEAVIFKTPGMRDDVPQLVAAKERGAVITSEMEVFCKLCPAPIIAVTGSDGKTTTTTLIYEMLKQAGYTCWLGGNIGTPLLSQVGSIEQSHRVVLELSSFQLQTMRPQPDVAVVTNLSPNHLDVHKSMEEYIQAKEHIFCRQQPHQRVVLNYDNDITRDMSHRAPGTVVFFSRRQKREEGVSLFGTTICVSGIPVLDTRDIQLPGVHNVENYMAAIGAVWGLVKEADIVHVAKTFGGVPHRIEFVKEAAGVKYYNDSIASSPTRSIAGLNSFEQKVILIAGGYDKNIPFDGLGRVIADRVKTLVLFGKTAGKIKEAVQAAPQYCAEQLPILDAADLKEAVSKAAEAAREGDVVILSPACASFDMFRNFEERGNLFKQYVMELTEHE